MRVLVDGIAFQNRYQRGVQRYCRELLSRVAQTNPVDLFLSDHTNAELPTGCRIVRRWEHFSAHHLNIPLRAWRKTLRRISPTRFQGYSVFHSTFFTQSPERDLPEVVTVHDLIAERFESKYHYWGQGYIDRLRLAMESARRIICISHATAADLALVYPHLMPKASVVHHGADHFLPDVQGACEPAVPENQHPFLLYVGDRERYKNFELLISALGDPAWPVDLKVVAAGPEPTEAERKSLRDRNIESAVRFAGPVSDKALRELFRTCTGFVFTSLCEGFGFPLLEAQSMGTPVICSDLPVFHETAGDTATFFDPRNPASVAAAAEKLMNGNAAATRAKGLQNVSRFRWDECARLTLEIYRAVAAE
jgi:glycosyltransferase involved in cell wall biosynthesis